ncbi:hypothetical protein USB125703_01193 [Pseudoclavibacter triregionum]|nr:hypothetical protein USB125703_01193 [Pseudoclavibacter triregionum]
MGRCDMWQPMKTVAVCVLAIAVSGALTACDRLRDDVTLAHVWDTEAASQLTSQRDVTSELCGISSACVEALAADQGLFLKFGSPEDAEAELLPGDVRVREIFIMRWNEGVPEDDRAHAQMLLETAGAPT